MIGIFKTQTQAVTGTTFEGTHFTIPKGKLWRLDKLSFQNQTAARGNLALICITNGVTNYLVPYKAMSTDMQVIDLYGIYLTEIDEIYVYITGLTAEDTIQYSFRGFEKDLVGVEFIV